MLLLLVVLEEEGMKEYQRNCNFIRLFSHDFPLVPPPPGTQCRGWASSKKEVVSTWLGGKDKGLSTGYELN